MIDRLRERGAAAAAEGKRLDSGPHKMGGIQSGAGQVVKKGWLHCPEHILVIGLIDVLP